MPIKSYDAVGYVDDKRDYLSKVTNFSTFQLKFYFFQHDHNVEPDPNFRKIERFEFRIRKILI